MVTRTQSHKARGTQPGVEEDKDEKIRKKRSQRRSSKESKRTRGEPRESSESEKNTKENQDKTTKPAINKEEAKESTEPSEGGPVAIDKVHEHLQATLDTYNSWITPLTVIPKKLQEYPNPREEKVRLAVGNDTWSVFE